nr:shikimate dehydrogenase [Steroidobacter cummioxidans]
MQMKKKSYLLGLIGSGISASRSPLLHEAEAAHHGIQLVYRLIDLKRLRIETDDLKHLLQWAETFGFDGFNVTHPYKATVIPLLHSVSSDANAIDAANTIVLQENRWMGHNTDWSGFAESVRRELPGVPTGRVAQIGAGGAGAATAYAMLRMGAGHVSIHDINLARATKLASDLQAQFPDRQVSVAAVAKDALTRADGVILATPVGSLNYPGMPFSPELITGNMWVADVIYTPLETPLLRAAREAGCRTINGSGMLIYQAAEAFRLFTGLTPDPLRMVRYFESSIESGRRQGHAAA